LDAAKSLTQRPLVRLPDVHQVLLQRLHDGLGQQRHAVLFPLPVPHGDLQTLEVQILDPLLQALVQPQSAPVKLHPHQPAPPLQLADDPHRLFGRVHHRQRLRLPRPHNVVEPAEVAFENFAIQEQQRRQSLILRRCRHLAFHRQVRQELGDFFRAHLQRMPHVMKNDEPPDPVDVRTLRLRPQVSRAAAVANLIQQPGLAGFGQRDRIRLRHDRSFLNGAESDGPRAAPATHQN
jgi:hypothetical protein